MSNSTIEIRRVHTLKHIMYTYTVVFDDRVAGELSPDQELSFLKIKTEHGKHFLTVEVRWAGYTLFSSEQLAVEVRPDSHLIFEAKALISGLNHILFLFKPSLWIKPRIVLKEI